MVAADFCFGDGILEGVEVEDLAIAVDQVAGEGAGLVVDIYDV